MTTPRQTQALELIRELGVVRPVDLEDRGIPRGILYRLVLDDLRSGSRLEGIWPTGGPWSGP